MRMIKFHGFHDNELSPFEFGLLQNLLVFGGSLVFFLVFLMIMGDDACHDRGITFCLKCMSGI